MKKDPKAPTLTATLAKGVDPKLVHELAGNMRVEPGPRINPNTLRELEPVPSSPSSEPVTQSTVQPAIELDVPLQRDISLDFELDFDATNECTQLRLVSVNGEAPPTELTCDLRGRMLTWRADRTFENRYVGDICFRHPSMELRVSSNDADDEIPDGSEARVRVRWNGGDHELQVSPVPPAGESGGTSTVIVINTEPTTMGKPKNILGPRHK